MIKKALIILAALLVASIAAAAVPIKEGAFTMYLLSDDISNNVYGSPPVPSSECTTGPGNPGNSQCNGNSGENPNGKDGWGTGVRGHGQ